MNLAEKFAKRSLENSLRLMKEEEEKLKKQKEKANRAFNIFIENTLLPSIEKAVDEGKFSVHITLSYEQKDLFFNMLEQYVKENGFTIGEVQDWSMNVVSNQYYVFWNISDKED